MTPQIVLTGGPGAGKTAILEVMRHHYSNQVLVLPESASIVYGGGFPRTDDDAGKRAAQRAIYGVQVELEFFAQSRHDQRTVLCDRGTLDGLAYWPDGAQTFFSSLGTSYERELNRYELVIHLHPPRQGHGYNHKNKVRLESADQALAIDQRIVDAWQGHPHRVFVEANDNFMHKAQQVIALIEATITGKVTVEAGTKTEANRT